MNPSAVLETGDRRRAERACELIASRLADPEAVARIVQHEDNTEPVFGISMWGATTLTHGPPGMAVFFGELARDDRSWRRTAHRHLSAAAAELPHAPPLGISGGPGALLTAAELCASGPEDYASMRGRLTAWLVTHQHERLAEIEARRAREPGVMWSDYDLVHGLGGTLRLLVALADPARHPSGPADGVRDAITATLRTLVALTLPLELENDVRVPGWWVPGHLQPAERDRTEQPDGHFNAGLAHGAPALLTVLAVAMTHGHVVAGQDVAILRVAEWLLSWRMYDDAGSYWPCMIGFDQQRSSAQVTKAFTRSAWCYGAPGVAVSLLHASAAVGEHLYRTAAVESLRAVLHRPAEDWRLDGATFCHGLSGLAHTLWRVGRATGDPELQDGCRDVTRRLLDYIDPELPLGVTHDVPDSPDGWRSAARRRRLHGAGLLEGAAGVGCVLSSVLEADPGHEPAWDMIFGMV